MPLPELVNFRQKYPHYNDISDIELSTKLAQKFPQAYGDLPQKAAMEANKSNPAMQGGANAPAVKQAQTDLKSAQMKASAPFTILKGLDDTANQIDKITPFGDRTKTLNPTTPQGRSNIAGEGLKVASFIPGVGPMVGGASYMAGESIEDQNKSAGGVALQGVLGAAGGKVLEVASPFFGKAIKATPQVIRKGIKIIKEPKKIERSINYIKDAFTGGEKARIAAKEQKFGIRQETAKQAKQISKTTAMKTNIVKSNQDAVNEGYDNLSNTLKKMIVKESDKESLSLQKDLPKLFSKKSEEYGLEKDALVKDKNISVPAKDALKPVENSLEQHGILRMENGQLVISRAPMTPAEHEIFSLYKNMKSLSDNPNAFVNIEDLMRTQKFTKPEFGRQWDSDDKLKSIVSQKLDGLIKDTVPGFKELQAKYKPFLEWKNAAIDKIKPFNSQYDVERGFVSKIGSGQLEPGEQRLRAELDNVLGRQVGGKVPALQKGLSSIMDKKQVAQEASDSVIKKMRTDAANKIFELRQKKNIEVHDIDQAVNQLVHQYKVRQLKIGVVGSLSLGGITKSALDYFFRREIYSGMKNNGG